MFHYYRETTQALRSYFNTLAMMGLMAGIGTAHAKPAFGIDRVKIGDRTVAVREEKLVDKPFGALIHFKRDIERRDPKILIFTPMSGHYATLMRETVRDLLPFHDVYIVDWHNARDVASRHGDFFLEDYIAHCEEFITATGPDIHALSLSQSTVPLMAIAALSSRNMKTSPLLSTTYLAGPLDVRAAETPVSRFARDHSMEWIERNMMERVATPHAGYGRQVLPGSLTKIAMLLAGKHDQESLTTMDLHGPYYRDTIRHVFKTHSLPLGLLTFNNRRVDTAHITDIPLLTIEGGKDTTTAPGQTMAAHFMCHNLPGEKKYHYLEPNSGHYDVFQGPTWRANILPRFAGFVRKSALEKGIIYDLAPHDTVKLPARWTPAMASPDLARLYTQNAGHNRKHGIAP